MRETTDITFEILDANAALYHSRACQGSRKERKKEMIEEAKGWRDHLKRSERPTFPASALWIDGTTRPNHDTPQHNAGSEWIIISPTPDPSMNECLLDNWWNSQIVGNPPGGGGKLCSAITTASRTNSSLQRRNREPIVSD